MDSQMDSWIQTPILKSLNFSETEYLWLRSKVSNRHASPAASARLHVALEGIGETCQSSTIQVTMISNLNDKQKKFKKKLNKI